MGTLRQDATTGQWVIVAPERADRPLPSGSARPSLPHYDPACPFCPGNEHLTPPEIGRHPADRAWEHRVVPNRYPALTAGLSPEERGDPSAREMDGVGAHEVVIESPLHDERLDDMPSDRLAAVLATWRDRSRALARESWARAIVVFKNFGDRAGTTLAHPHSQIMATPVIPPEALHRLGVAVRYHQETGRCVYADLLERELHDGARVVASRDGFVAVSPFACRLPFETWITPRSPAPSFGSLADGQIRELADLLREVVGALRRAAGDPDYNLVVYSAPVGEEANLAFLSHLRVLPRTVISAGFELGSGMSINGVAPEQAARLLREAMARVPAR